MGFNEPEFSDNDDAGGGKSLNPSKVSCSICLELVVFDDGRSCVKLICGHEFHLDCIGSAFNSRGAMQCPNCRNTEKGQWLYGSGGPSFDDPHDEEFYDLSYSEMSLGVGWCPFTYSQLSSSFEDREIPSSAYHDLLGHQALFAEHASVSSANQPPPYFSYYGPIHSSSTSTRPSISDNAYNNHWSTSLLGLNDVPTSPSFPSMDPHYHSWEHHSSSPLPAVNNRLGNAEQPSVPSINQRSSRANSGVTRPGFAVHPFLAGGHSSSRRASNNMSSAMIPPYPGSGSGGRTRDHRQAHFQPPPSSSSPPPRGSSTRHSGSHRGSSSSSDPAGGGYYIFPSNGPNRIFSEADRILQGWERVQLNPPLNQGEREPDWGLFGSGTSNLRSGSDRPPSQGRS